MTWRRMIHEDRMFRPWKCDDKSSGSCCNEEALWVNVDHFDKAATVTGYRACNLHVPREVRALFEVLES